MSKWHPTLLPTRHRIALLAALTLAACGTTPERRPSSSSPSAAALPIPLDMRAQVRNSEVIGRQIYILDKVSAIATDVLREKGMMVYLIAGTTKPDVAVFGCQPKGTKVVPSKPCSSRIW